MSRLWTDRVYEKVSVEHLGLVCWCAQVHRVHVKHDALLKKKNRESPLANFHFFVPFIYWHRWLRLTCEQPLVAAVQRGPVCVTQQQTAAPQADTACLNLEMKDLRARRKMYVMTFRFTCPELFAKQHLPIREPCALTFIAAGPSGVQASSVLACLVEMKE